MSTFPIIGDHDGTARASWLPGDQVLWRYLREDRVLDCRPVTVIQDTSDQLAVWLAAGTERVKPALPDGSDIRTAPIERRFRVGRVPSIERWHGTGVVMLSRPGQPWSVWLFWGPGWHFNGWYVNLERPQRRWAGGVDSEDHVLDIWVTPDGRYEWKDEDELAACRDAGRFTEAECEALYADGRLAIEVVREWGPPFCDGWEHFRPDPAWPLPELPADWDRPAGTGWSP